MRLPIHVSCALSIALAIPGSVLAADGVLEINQACVATGCFPGDTPGFPVQGTSAGSYVLTSNLTVPDVATSAITLAAGSSLDLGGFTVSGPVTCSGAPATCSGFGAGTGIGVGAQSSIRNGRVQGMGSTGIGAGDGLRIRDVTLFGNGGNGIVGQAGFVIENCVIDSNGYDGIQMNAGQVGATVIQGNSVLRNAQVGIRAAIAVVKDNGVKSNGSFGYLGSSSALSGNNFYNNNAGGDQISGGVEVGENLCNGSTVCP